MTVLKVPEVRHRFVEVPVDAGTVRVFFREAGRRERPTMLLLHGFPSASHQFRRLIDVLGGRYRLVAPDYPGFGHTEVPAGFTYSFETLSDVIEGFVDAVGLGRVVLYAFDFGGPVGFRLATRRPEMVAGLVIQNANAYEAGLSELARTVIGNRPGVPGAEDRARELLTLPVTRGQYQDGVGDLELVAPDGWTLDQHFLDRPDRRDAQVALALDYHSNVALYPTWQRWLRDHQPPALIVWGTNDAFFTEAGARAYLADLPHAELHTFATGHFALEERLGDIAPLIAAFLDRTPTHDPVRPDHGGTPLTLAVIGATGHLGRAIAREAVARGHQVTALGRATADITDPAAVADAVAGHDAVVASVKGPDRLVPRGAATLLEALPKAGVRRLLFVGGGASLRDASGQRFVDSPDFPPEYLETARDQAEALDLLRRSDTAVEWSYLSPPPMHLLPGDKTGTYRTAATDEPILGDDGDSRITLGDLAAAAVDTLETGTFLRQRFTAAY